MLFFFFLFFFHFSLFHLFLSLSFGFCASGITCIWFSIEKNFLEVIIFSCAPFFLHFFLFLTKQMLKMKKTISSLKRGCHILAARALLVRCAVEKSKIVCVWWHFGSQILVWSVVVRFISISVLTHVVFSQWSFGPCGQASSRSSTGQPNDGTNESFPCVHVWSGLCIACPYPC